MRSRSAQACGKYLILQASKASTAGPIPRSDHAFMFPFIVPGLFCSGRYGDGWGLRRSSARRRASRGIHGEHLAVRLARPRHSSDHGVLQSLRLQPVFLWDRHDLLEHVAPVDPTTLRRLSRGDVQQPIPHVPRRQLARPVRRRTSCRRSTTRIPNPAQMCTHLARFRRCTARWRITTRCVSGASWGQSVYTGATGSPSVIDYRGVVRYMEEVESPGYVPRYYGFCSPAELFDVMQNGNANSARALAESYRHRDGDGVRRGGYRVGGMEDVHRLEERQGHERPRFDVAHARRSQDELV